MSIIQYFFPIPPAPGQVMIVSFEAESNTSLTLTWQDLPLTEHNGVLLGHNLSLTNNRSNATLSVFVNSSTSQYTFTGMYVGEKGVVM